MRSIHLLTYDVRATSPAQPRLAAVAAELRARGYAVTLYSAFDPGQWPETVGVAVELVSDPVLRIRQMLLRWRERSASVAASAGSVPHAVPRPLSRFVRTVLFPDNMVVWSLLTAIRLRSHLHPDDLVFTSSPPESVNLAGRFAQVGGARWWADFADGWCHQGLRYEAMTPGLRRSLERRLERYSIRRADAVSTVNDSIADWFRTLRVDREVRIFPNIIPPELEAVADPDAPRPPGSPPVLGYLGRLSLSDPLRSLRPLLALLEAFAPPLSFLFRGDFGTTDLAEIQALRALGYAVDLAGPVSRTELPALRDQLDGLLVILSPDQKGSSSKLFDALGLALPLFVLAHPQSEAAQMVNESGYGETAPLDTPEEAAGILRRFLDRLGAEGYRLDPTFQRRHCAAAWVPGLVDELAALGGERTVREW